jgi:hypothetical protein
VLQPINHPNVVKQLALLFLVQPVGKNRPAIHVLRQAFGGRDAMLGRMVWLEEVNERFKSLVQLARLNHERCLAPAALTVSTFAMLADKPFEIVINEAILTARHIPTLRAPGNLFKLVLAGAGCADGSDCVRTFKRLAAH